MICSLRNKKWAIDSKDYYVIYQDQLGKYIILGIRVNDLWEDRDMGMMIGNTSNKTHVQFILNLLYWFIH